MLLKSLSKKSYPVLLALFLFTLFYFLSTKVPEEKIRLVLNQAGLLAPLVFIFLALPAYIIAPLSNAPLLWAGFYAFGANVVFLFTIASVIGLVINFWIARRWGRTIIKKFVGSQNMERIDKLTENYGLLMLFFLRVFQGGISDFVSYAAGLTSMRFPQYLIISLLGLIPGTIIWYLGASQIENPAVFTGLTMALVVTLSTIFILAILVIRKVKSYFDQSRRKLVKTPAK